METHPLVPGAARRLPPPLVVRLLTCASSIGEGFDIGVFAGVVVRVKQEWALTSWEVSLLMGVMPLGIAVGALLSGPLADRAGRRSALAVSYAVLVLAPLLMALADGYVLLMLGRGLVSVGIGVGLATVICYVAEVAPAASRGTWGVLEDLFFEGGMLAGFIANVALLGVSRLGLQDWRLMLALGVLAPTVCLAGLVLGFIPESPRYLLLAGRRDEALAVLTHMVGSEEASATLVLWKAEAAAEKATIADLFATPQRRRMTAAGVSVFVMQMWSGIPAVNTLSSLLLTKTHGDASRAFQTTLGIGITKTATLVVVLIYVLDQLGRRPMLLASAGGTAAAAFATALGFAQGWGVGAIQWCLYAFGLCFALGLGPVPFVYTAEVFPTELRSSGAALAMAASRVMKLSVLVSFPLMLDQAGAVPIFVLYGVLNLLSVPLIWVCCPETKQRKLEDTKDLFA